MMITTSYQWASPWEALPACHEKHITLGDGEGGPVTLDLDLLLSGRLLIQAPSGAGKTTLLKRLISQCARIVQHIIVDPEGEYVGSLDFSDFSREQQLTKLAELVQKLMQAPRNEPLLVVIDEVEIFTPTDCSAFDDPRVGKRSKMALVELMSRGRKRKLIACIATHRLAQLAASVRAEARNLIIGGSSFDVDIRRAADALGWAEKKAFEIIPKLPVGHFVCVGPAFNKSPAIVKIPQP